MCQEQCKTIFKIVFQHAKADKDKWICKHADATPHGKQHGGQIWANSSALDAVNSHFLFTTSPNLSSILLCVAVFPLLAQSLRSLYSAYAHNL